MSKAASTGTIEPLARKSPAYVPDTTSYDSQSPAWRLSHLDDDGPFGWTHLDQDEVQTIRARLVALESQTWHEILVRDKRNNHSIAVEDLDRRARKRLQELKLDDLDAVVSIRVSAKQRLFGFRRQNAFHALWWDPDHEVCPAPLKNT
ncbi:MAG: hypothetical protein U0002_07425 [Thermoanaerobaculia bacterium]